MNGNSKTLAFQVSEEFFQRVKTYLAKHPKLSQKDFVVGLIEQELDRFEKQEAQPEQPDTDSDGSADKSSPEDGAGCGGTPENPPNNDDAAE